MREKGVGNEGDNEGHSEGKEENAGGNDVESGETARTQAEREVEREVKREVEREVEQVGKAEEYGDDGNEREEVLSVLLHVLSGSLADRIVSTEHCVRYDCLFFSPFLAVIFLSFSS